MIRNDRKGRVGETVRTTISVKFREIVENFVGKRASYAEVVKRVVESGGSGRVFRERKSRGVW